VTRARKIQRFLSQPMFVSKVFTGIDGINVPVKRHRVLRALGER